MFDIDALVFGTKKKSKAMPKLKNSGIKSFNLLGGNTRHFIIKDKVTKPQRVILKSNNWNKIWGDSDKDGVINGLDCRPKNKKKHMAFVRKSGVSFVDFPSPAHRVTQTEMSPDEYLTQTYNLHKRNTEEAGKPWQYKDKEEYLQQNVQMSRIPEYKEKISRPDLTMDAPWLEKEQGVVKEQEGRHRAYAARELGVKSIPVNVVETNTKYWASDIAKKAVKDIGELDPDGTCSGNCKPISERISSQIPGSKVIETKPFSDIGTRHKAVLLPTREIVDTQTWQHSTMTPDDLDKRKVVFNKKDYEENYEIQPDAPYSNNGGK